MFNDEPQVNPKKLFVGNLPWSTTEEDLREVFAQFGELAEENGIRLITDRMSGRSKGIAFVEYTTEEAAQAALEGTQGLELDGRVVNVSIARPPKPREERGSGGFGGSRGGFGGGDRRGGGGFGGSRGGFGGGDRRGGGSDRRSGGGGYNRDR